MDDRPAVAAEELTEAELAETIAALKVIQSGDAEVGFTTREYCVARGLDPSPSGRGYRVGLEELRSLKAVGTITPTKLKRLDIYDRRITTRGWKTVRESPALRQGEEGPELPQST